MSKRLIPYITMDGNAKEAIEFYEKALDAQLLFIQTFGEMPENPDFPIPAEVKERVGHATLKVGETELMFSDTFPGSPFSSGNQVSICITTDSVEQAQKMFDALQQGGQVGMPLQATHFSPAYGNVTDKFGVTFQMFTEARS
ncbi:VOC family protein [Paenibacillus polymyxa]|uniref:Glyoxalase/bleomycin resistance protein/dioxygenase n=1 Tax=Paenibacillus polymyxa TaxID=1406 RepID=A0A0F6EYE4_PAEPO|nr:MULTISPECIES: VOC family protein [Paenibacillus]AIY11008.1 3-demethylubiquinone-9 3-methyltransferase [Paenibacillus polymyxa]AUS26062.1 3-demethylubiquinone-9 3-methyltransferase [Paenibacillus polymyxa]KAF6582574.1 VOC family protein [Paenibacillus sp. EKM211P]KAF6618989.1 VOC family protein [Paenibacillus sp. EKM101P]KAF6624081.1 VOC family protein [Paenibacillus sp. EKM102P]